MKKILKRDGVFGLTTIEFYKVDGELVAWWWEYDGEEYYDPSWDDRYECGCCKCCGCMCWMEGEDEDE